MSKKLFLTLGSVLTLTPLAFVTSCNNETFAIEDQNNQAAKPENGGVDSNQQQPQPDSPDYTVAKQDLKASVFGFNDVVEIEKSKITSTWVVNNIDKLLNGKTKVTNDKDINLKLVQDDIKLNILTIEFELLSNMAYDIKGNLIDKPTPFKVIISEFVSTSPSFTQAKQGLTASSLKLKGDALSQENIISNDWIFSNRSMLLDGKNSINNSGEITNKQVTIDPKNDSLTIKFTVAANTVYDQRGQLIKEPKEFNVAITGFDPFNPEKYRTDFENAVLKSGFNKLANIATPTGKAVCLGNTTITEQTQKDAIVKYLQNIYGTPQITHNEKDDNYRITVSAGTAQRCANVFGSHWNHIMSSVSNKDLKSIRQVVLIFKLYPKNNKPILVSNEVAEYVFMPQALQFSWDTNNNPYWFNDKQTSVRVQFGKTPTTETQKPNTPQTFATTTQANQIIAIKNSAGNVGELIDQVIGHVPPTNPEQGNTNNPKRYETKK